MNHTIMAYGSPFLQGLSQESTEGEGGGSERHSGEPNSRNALQDFQNKTRVLSFGGLVQVFLPFMKLLITYINIFLEHK